MAVAKKGYKGPKVVDTETFIQKAVWQHGNKYDYSEVNYVNSSSKVAIICKKHGRFYQRAAGHYSGKGCRECGIQSRSDNQRRSYEEFVEMARTVHGDKYDYSESEYKNVDKKVKIICPDHGVFYQTPHAHIFRKYKCIKCSTQETADGNRKTLDEYIKQAREVHGDTYDYSLVEYQTTHDKVKIVCPEHGVFEQVAKSHLCGHRCNECAAMDRGWTHTQKIYRSDDFESNLYLVKMFDESTGENFLKVGLSIDPVSRHRQIENESKYNVVNLYVLNGTGKKLYETERQVLFKSNFEKYYPNNHFGGQSECLKSGQTKQIIDFIEDFYYGQ